MVDYRVDISEPAEKDLMGIVRYINSQLSAPGAALKIMEDFEKALTSLSKFPQRCPMVVDEGLAKIGYRKLIVNNYIVFFSINEKAMIVDVERILYYRRDWLRFI